MRKKVNWILDLDLRTFLDRVDHACELLGFITGW
jgi:hypothetical protein